MQISSRSLAGGLLLLALTQAAVAAAAAVATGLSFTMARDSFLITNSLIGVGCAVSGGLIAWHRPRNRVGWLLLGAGIAQTATPAVTPWLIDALQEGGPVKLAATLYSLAWPWSVSLFIPLALIYFPDGKLPGPAWRPAVLLTAANSVVQVLIFSAAPNPLVPVRDLETDGRATSWLAIALFNDQRLHLASDLMLTLSLAAGLAGLVVRFRRGDEKARRQLLWLLLAATVTVVVAGSMRLLGPVESSGFPIIVTSVVTLLPVSMVIAVLRYQLLDIRLVWARAVTYLLLTAAVAATYLVLVEAASRALRGAAPAVLATLLVAALFNPVRVRLQRHVEHLLYGDRANPLRAASSVAHQLAGASEPADVLPAVCQALRLPYAALTDDAGVIRGEHGTRPSVLETIPLVHAAEPAGELQIGLRPGESRLAAADRVVLELMAAPIGVALRARALSDALQRSRRDIVSAREEERRRIHRDLHDGLGPALTGIGFRADTVTNLAAEDQLAALGTEIRAAVDTAMTDVRRLINQLHPSALDDLGLVEAVRRHADLLDRRSDGFPLRVTVAAGRLPDDLPAAVEVTAYRIATEALTNVVRHSRAGQATVQIAARDDELELTIADDGPAAGGRWVPGVGLTSMRERVAELGGTMIAEPTPAGGRVHLCLPLGLDR